MNPTTHKVIKTMLPVTALLLSISTTLFAQQPAAPIPSNASGKQGDDHQITISPQRDQESKNATGGSTGLYRLHFSTHQYRL